MKYKIKRLILAIVATANKQARDSTAIEDMASVLLYLMATIITSSELYEWAKSNKNEGG